MDAIGMFDSGVGGLTVLKEVMKALPHERFIYFGDTARVPYGNKSPETILRYSLEISLFLSSQGVKLLINACNTSSAYALKEMQKEIALPIIGVIEPGAKKACAVTRNKKIAVLATRATIQSKAYEEAIRKRISNAQIYPIPCPLLVPLVEENWIDHPATTLILKEYLSVLLREEVDTVLLGCTHYPLLKEQIGKLLGDQVCIVDSATTCAEEAKEVLAKENLFSRNPAPSHSYYVSDDTPKFQQFGQKLLGLDIPHVELVSELATLQQIS